MLSTLSYLPLLAFVASSANAHMSIWSKAMYGVGTNFDYDAGDPVSPIGPDWGEQDDWWFRGPSYRALPPQDGAIEVLPAGGSITFEIACHVAWTSYGVATTKVGSDRDACPGNSGAYHSGDPDSDSIDPKLLSGCALGIADVDDINDVTMDNLAIFSVNHNCVKQKMTTFEIPARMPACTGSKCICAWFWLAANGTGNFYMTAFDCSVSGSPADATPIMAPVDPTWCAPGTVGKTCQTQAGAKRPLYVYNTPSNIVWQGNYDRPGYHDNWSFGTDGAQNDIFAPAGTTKTTTAKAYGTSTGVVAAGATGTASAPSSSATLSANLALKATAKASSVGGTQTADNVNDGVIGGYVMNGSGDESAEWSSDHEGVGATLTLTWPSAVTFNQLVLFDRPNLDDRIFASNVTFSDGTTISLGALNNDGSATTFNFATVTTTTLVLKVTQVSAHTSNVGLSEIQAFLTGVAASGASSVASSTEISASSTTTRKPYDPSSTGVVGVGSEISSTSSSASSSVVTSAPVSTSTVASSSVVVSSSAPAPLVSVVSSVVSPVVSVVDNVLSNILAPPAATTTTVSSSSSATTTTKKAYGASSGVVAAGAAPSSTSSLTTSAAPSSPTLKNLARSATVTGSTVSGSQGFNNVNDGVQGGYGDAVGDESAEWSSDHEGAGAWVQLTWPSAVTFNQLVIFDRPNKDDRILGAQVWFADGSSAFLGSLKNDGSATYFNFTSITTTSLRYNILKVSSSTSNVGLSELEVYQTSTNGNIITPTPALVNLARTASVTGSSVDGTQGVDNAVDGIKDGYGGITGDESAEWSSDHEGVGAWIKLGWTSPVTLNQLVIFDRPNSDDQIQSALITFEDGSWAKIGALANDGSATYFNFTSVTTTSVQLTVTKVSGSTSNVGLSEIEIYSTTTSGSLITPTAGLVNVALSATATASSQMAGQGFAAAIDGLVGGYPGNSAQEWSTDHEGKNAWLKLTWSSPVTVNQMLLFDRPNLSDQIKGAKVTFSDKSTFTVGELKNDGSVNYFTLPKKSITSLLFTITKVSGSTSNIGLSEIKLFNNPDVARRSTSDSKSARHARDFTATGVDFADQVLVAENESAPAVDQIQPRCTRFDRSCMLTAEKMF